jgi:uncharacterized membrane protein YhaH (DUF805 family)
MKQDLVTLGLFWLVVIVMFIHGWTWQLLVLSSVTTFFIICCLFIGSRNDEAA